MELAVETDASVTLVCAYLCDVFEYRYEMLALQIDASQ